MGPDASFARLAVFLLALFVAACPEDLKEPECYAPQEAVECTIPDFDAAKFLGDRCGTSTCHGADRSPDGTNALDLESDGLFERLTTQHAVDPGCASLTMIDPGGNANTSYLLQKLYGTQSCGQSMPDFGASLLPQDELDCITRWALNNGDEGFIGDERCYARRVDAGTSDVGGDTTMDMSVDTSADTSGRE